MHLNQLETFMWVAALKNFHAAAVRLNVTQPGVSARILALEAELGMKLLTRRQREVTLTKDGHEFMRYAQEVLRLTAELKSRKPDLDSGERTIRIGMVGTLSHAMLTPLVEGVLRQFPRANIDIVIDSTANLQRLLGRREIDIAFIVGVIYEPNIRSIWVAEMRIEWLACPALAAGRKSWTLKDLARNRIVTYEEGTHVSLELDILFKAHELAPVQWVGCTSIGMIIDLVRHGIGIGTLPAPTVRSEIEKGEIVVLSTRAKLPVFDVFVCYATDSPGDVGVAVAAVGRRICEGFKAR